MPAPVKRLAATCLALAPQGRFDRCLFLVGHMRCGSTALANVLCAHPSVSGYGETHVRYDRPSAPGALILNQLRRGRWRPRATHLFDKLLHDDLDATPPPAFFTARAIFVTWASVWSSVFEASMPMTRRSPRSSRATPAIMPAWVEPVTVQTMT